MENVNPKDTYTSDSLIALPAEISWGHEGGLLLPGKSLWSNSRTLSFVGGILSILAIGLPWWTAVASTGEITAIFLLSFGFPPTPPSLGPWQLAHVTNGLEIDYRMLFPSIVIDLPLMTMGGLLGILGSKTRLARQVAAGLVAGALVVFLLGLSTAIMPPIGPLEWYGNGPALGGSIAWSLSMGFYLAVFALLFLLSSSLPVHQNIVSRTSKVGTIIAFIAAIRTT